MTTREFTWPVAPPVPLSLVPPSARRVWRILVVDDDEVARRFVCIVLSRLGYAVDAAVDGEEAWELVRQLHYDLLVLDHDLPRLSGLELMRRLPKAGIHLRAVLHSADAASVERAAAERHFAGAFRKSDDFGRMVEAIQELLPLSRSRAAVGQTSPPGSTEEGARPRGTGSGVLAVLGGR